MAAVNALVLAHPDSAIEKRTGAEGELESGVGAAADANCLRLTGPDQYVSHYVSTEKEAR